MLIFGEGKQGTKTKDILKFLGYSLKDLMIHIESLFQPNMSWNNYGRPNNIFENGWHIDHIKPVCSFRFNSYTDEEFKKCWELNNLRPLWAMENLKKLTDDKKQSLKKQYII